LSNFDFSGLAFDQILKVEQTALDPDSKRGLSVRFQLADEVDYQFFDGEMGSMILLFESQKVANNDKPEPSTVDLEEAVAPIIEIGDRAKPIAMGPETFMLAGASGESNLNNITVSTLGSAVQVTAQATGLQSYKYFYLTEPERYILDFYGVYCRLDRDILSFNSSLISKIRVKQFQVHPEPITRMVLDLVEPMEIQLDEVGNGQFVLLAGKADFSTSQSQMSVSNDNSEPVLQQKVEEIKETFAIAAQEKKTAVSDPIQSEPLGQEVVEQVVTMSTEEGVPEVQVEDQKTEKVPTETQAVQELTFSEPIIDRTESEVIETAEVKIHTDDSLEAQEIQADLPIKPVSEEPEVVSEKRTLIAEEEPARDKPKAHQLPFMQVDNVDKELDSFIQDDTFYSKMRDAKPLKPQNKHIKVTNHAISSSLNLSESNALQSEDEVRSDFENSSLFVESEEQVDTDRIAGGGQKYRGFEIQGIDVVDVNVTDLLRFFADQVGFNLYVDPSVKDLKATYKFSNIPWDQAMEIILRNAGLDYQYDNGVLRVATTEKFKDEAAARRELRIEQELSVPPETVTFRLSYAKAEEIAPIVQEYLSPRGSLLQDERTNTLIIEDIPKKMVAIRSLIKKLDTQIPQVTIESRVVETTKRFIKELGIQWGLSGLYAPEYGTQTGMTFPNRVTVGGPATHNFSAPAGTLGSNVEGGYAVNFPVIDPSTAGGLGFSLGNILDTFKLDISLQMIESDGLGQIISAPKITTQNNKTALIQNGQRIPVQTIQRGTITVRYINAVLELEVTPHITSDKTIIMDLIVDKSEPDFTREVLGNPIINVRRAETRVLVKDGGTAVIGGIYVMNDQESSKGIPGLRKIPFIRRAFGSERQEITNQELLIFVTPRIVKY